MNKLITTNYKMGKGLSSWRDGSAQSITFVVTEDCNLRCKYCYISHKSTDNKMSFETARKFILCTQYSNGFIVPITIPSIFL